MSAVKYSILGFCLISGAIGITSYYNLNKIDKNMQRDVAEWNTHLPEGFTIRLNKNVHFMGAEGSYILSNDKEGKTVDIFTLNFTSNFNIFTLILPTSKLPIKGDGVLDIQKLNNEELEYTFNSESKEFLTFDGYIERNGNFSISYKQNSYLLGMITSEQLNPTKLYLNIQSNTGSFSKVKENFEFLSSIPKIEMLDTPDQKDGIAIQGIKTSLKFTQNDNSVNTVFTNNVDSIEDMAPTQLFNIKGIDTVIEVDENNKDFTHKVKMNIKSANTQEQKDVSMNLDYDMSVPIESKSAIISLLSSQQDADYIEKQENAFKLYKSGFNFSLNKFQFTQGKENGNIIFKVQLKPQTPNELLSDRISFNGNIDIEGSSVPAIQMNIPIPLDEFNLESENPQKLKMNFDYHNNTFTINDKKSDKSVEDIIIKSLVGLDMMMKEAEAELNREKENIANGLVSTEISAENNLESIEEIPGTEIDETLSASASKS